MNARAALPTLVSSLALLLAGSTARAAPLLNTFGGPLGYGTNVLEPNDDQFSDAQDLTVAFPGGLRYFGTNYTTFYVNNNGNISFAMGLFEYVPMGFPIASQPMIGPWWADVDTRGGGNPMINSVWWHSESGRVVVTWNQVGYYSQHNDQLNSFQLVLSADAACPGPGNFDVEFRYDQCNWSTSDSSGGVQAQAGFDAGNLVDYYSLPGSRTPTVTDLCATHNGTGIPGDWLFSICDGVIVGGCPGGGARCMVPGLQGVCAPGINRCAGMGGTVCTQTVQPSAEQCDGLDNDCDGAVDDGIAPQACYEGSMGTAGVGLCHGGARACTGGAFGSCAGQVLPAAELCDGLDNDCNGRPDDLSPRSCYTGPTGTSGVGVCSPGTQPCAGGAWGACTAQVLPQPEVCDGLDNDCNGAVDEGLTGCMPEPLPEPTPDAATDAPVDAVSEATLPDVPLAEASMDDARGDLGAEADATNHCNGDPHCDRSLRVEGRAGPIGCACRAGAPRSGGRGVAGLSAAMLGLLLASRRRRRCAN